MPILLHPAQNQVASDTHRFRVMNCGRRFGKTVLACEEILGCALYNEDAHISYFAPARDDARDIMWSMLVKRCEGIITYKNDSRLELKVRNNFKGESMIVLYGWESVQERGKGRGLSNDFIVCDEVSSMRNFWVGWDEVLSPTLIDRKGSALFISTPKGFNHFYDLTNLELKDNDYKSFHFTSYDNPYIPKEEIDREKRTKSDDVFSQEYLADFRKTQGLVYKEFSRADLYTEDVVGYSESLAGVDFGFTNPCAVLSIYFKDGVYYVEDELYKTGLTDAKVAEYVAGKGYNKVYPDPENPAAIKEMSDRKVNVREVVKGKDSIVNGINKVREVLLEHRLKVNARCINLIAEFETYSYPDSHNDRNESENPVDDNNHALDALRYVIMMHKAKKQIIQQPFRDLTIDIWNGK